MFKRTKRSSHRKFDVGPAASSEQDDTNYYRCGVCGWICNSEIVESQKHGSEETDYVDGNSYTYTPGTADSLSDIIVSRGCPFCGTLFSKR